MYTVQLKENLMSLKIANKLEIQIQRQVERNRSVQSYPFIGSSK